MEIPKDTCIIEYKGEQISWKKALDRHPHDLTQPNHTFYFSLSSGKVIDGNIQGNESKWVNHSCEPNCEAREIKDGTKKTHVFLFALRKIKKHEELVYDYRLEIEGRLTKTIKKEYQCYCGMKKCRKTMLYKS
jgi:SET domain-containing protein